MVAKKTEKIKPAKTEKEEGKKREPSKKPKKEPEPIKEAQKKQKKKEDIKSKAISQSKQESKPKKSQKPVENPTKNDTKAEVSAEAKPTKPRGLKKQEPQKKKQTNGEPKLDKVKKVSKKPVPAPEPIEEEDIDISIQEEDDILNESQDLDEFTNSDLEEGEDFLRKRQKKSGDAQKEDKKVSGSKLHRFEKLQKIVDEYEGKADARGVLYLGHLPYGFMEPQIREYFSQFGEVYNVKLFRSKKVWK